MTTKKLPLRLLTSFVLVYMVLAFGWWAIELWRENDRIFEVSYELLETQQNARKRGLNLTELKSTAEYIDMVERRQKHRRMILAEGVFFTLCLGFGLYVINRSAKREVALTRQRRNFLLSITHELKSPIAAIRLSLETISKRQLNRVQQEKFCSNGLRDATRLQTLVEDLLLAARLEDSWRPLAEPFDLNQITRECAETLQSRFPKADIQIQIPEDFPIIQADKPGLTAVIQNLLENAVKYSPKGSPVILSAEHARKKIQLQVSDEGVGIPEGEKEAVFESFYRIGNEETRQTTGTGLGLYIVKQVVEAHKGQISIRDNKPKGAVFTVTI